jgi:(p)ppGpp synthase/HD superfamily hydrolase
MNIKEGYSFFKKLHKKQKYNDGGKYHPHLFRVGMLIRNTLIINKEGNKKEINNLTLAGFGHDSLEDTKISIAKLKLKFGEEVTELIIGMTNKEGDLHTYNYIKQVCNSKEEVRLIKLADICDNLMRLIQKPNNPNFLREKVLPIIIPMHKQIVKTHFKKYPKSSKSLIETSNILMKLAKDIVKK